MSTTRKTRKTVTTVIPAYDLKIFKGEITQAIDEYKAAHKKLNAQRKHNVQSIELEMGKAQDTLEFSIVLSSYLKSAAFHTGALGRSALRARIHGVIKKYYPELLDPMVREVFIQDAFIQRSAQLRTARKVKREQEKQAKPTETTDRDAPTKESGAFEKLHKELGEIQGAILSLNKENENLKATRDELIAQLERSHASDLSLHKENETLKSVRDGLTTTVAHSQASVTALQQENEMLTSSRDELIDDLNQSQAALKGLDLEIERLIKSNQQQEAQIKELLEKNIQLKLQLEEKIKELLENNVQLKAQMAAQQERLDSIAASVTAQAKVASIEVAPEAEKTVGTEAEAGVQSEKETPIVIPLVTPVVTPPAVEVAVKEESLVVPVPPTAASPEPEKAERKRSASPIASGIGSQPTLLKGGASYAATAANKRGKGKGSPASPSTATSSAPRPN